MTISANVVQAIADAADAINTADTPAGTMQAIVTVARDSMPDIDHVGITISDPAGNLATDAATDELVHVLDHLQYDLDQGPCMSTLTDDSRSTLAEQLRLEGRWHDWVAQALPLGVQAVLAVRLSATDRTVGVLNMYSTNSETNSEDTRSLAELFAILAAMAYGHVREVGHLHRALETRERSGMAVGVVMERYGLSPERAFQYLVRAASASEVKLRVVAEMLLGQLRVPTDGV